MIGCNLLVAVDFPPMNLSIVNRAAAWQLSIPNSSSLAGSVFYVQGLVLLPGVNQFGAIVTNGGTCIIGG